MGALAKLRLRSETDTFGLRPWFCSRDNQCKRSRVNSWSCGGGSAGWLLSSPPPPVASGESRHALLEAARPPASGRSPQRRAGAAGPACVKGARQRREPQPQPQPQPRGGAGRGEERRARALREPHRAGRPREPLRVAPSFTWALQLPSSSPGFAGLIRARPVLEITLL